jgi:hypothetical protein
MFSHSMFVFSCTANSSRGAGFFFVKPFTRKIIPFPNCFIPFPK